MDALTDILNNIRLHTQTFFCDDFSAPWGMHIESSDRGLFHIVIQGHCTLRLPDGEAFLELEEGDIVAFPTGAEHWISDASKTVSLPGKQVLQGIMQGTNPFSAKHIHETPSASARMLCGALLYDSSIKHPFLRDLPQLIFSPRQNNTAIWRQALIERLSCETRNTLQGGAIVVDRLTEVLFVDLLREHIQKEAQDNNFLHALNDPKIGKALNLIHSNTEQIWTVESLSQMIGLSRGRFTQRFSNLVSESPKSYLNRHYLSHAKHLLQHSDLSMLDIALRAGYQSEAAFSKAFKKMFDVSPGKSRRLQEPETSV